MKVNEMGAGVRKNPYRGRGHITKHYAAPKALFDYLWQLIAPLGTPGAAGNRAERMRYHRFLAHIYVSQAHCFINKGSR